MSRLQACRHPLLVRGYTRVPYEYSYEYAPCPCPCPALAPHLPPLHLSIGDAGSRCDERIIYFYISRPTVRVASGIRMLVSYCDALPARLILYASCWCLRPALAVIAVAY